MNNKKRNALLIALIGTLSFTVEAVGLDKKIQSIAPHVKYRNRLKIARAVKGECVKRYNLDANLVLSVIKVESDFRIDAYNKSSMDYGLMQVNHWHVSNRRLSVKKLLRSPRYNLRNGCLILHYFVTRYSFGDAISRYNCGTGKGCVNWKAVKRYRRMVLRNYKMLTKKELENE